MTTIWNFLKKRFIKDDIDNLWDTNGSIWDLSRATWDGNQYAGTTTWTNQTKS